jgi:16S rRNA (guanine966-N2)-methyltransferase
MSHRPLGRLRVIGGEWRSRLIEFDAADGVRPTPDRVRQTLFDWLSPIIAGAACVDLFAGSGALGFEALSRGAATACFVETGLAQTQAMHAAAAKLGATSRVEIVNRDALAWLRNTRAQFDIAFVDPPYAAGLWQPVLLALQPVLKSNNRVYVEWPKAVTPLWPSGWRVLKEKTAGQVSYALATYEAPVSQDPSNPGNSA